MMAGMCIPERLNPDLADDYPELEDPAGLEFVCLTPAAAYEAGEESPQERQQQAWLERKAREARKQYRKA